MVQEHYKKEERKERKHKIQKGGVAPLLAIGLPVLGALASEIVKDIYGVVKKKMFGGELKHKSVKSQKLFLKYFVNLIWTFNLIFNWVYLQKQISSNIV